MLPLFLLLFVPAAALGAGLIAHSLLKRGDFTDYHSDYEEKE